MSDLKHCGRCDEMKPLDDFYRNRNARDERTVWCKCCSAEYARGWHERHRERSRAASARWRATNPDRSRELAVLKKYGLTTAAYEAMLAGQEGRCAICQTEEPKGQGRFHVDHDHNSGAIRGLLCNACNLGLGHFKDDPNLLTEALRYLGSCEF